MKKLLLVTATVALLCLGVGSQAAAKYHIVDLGDLGGGTSEALAINNTGQVVGRSIAASGQTHAFVWDSGSGIQDLGVLGGYGGEAYGINDKGQIVGIAYTTGHTGPNDGKYSAFLWSESSGMRELVALYSGGASWARSINATGQVAGVSHTADGQIRGVIWDADGGIQSVGTFVGGDFSEGFAINDNGLVVGRAGLFGVASPSQAFVWDSTSGIQPVGPSYGPGGSTAYGVNNLGCVAGSFRTGGGIHAFRWTESGGIEDLGGPSGQWGVWGEGVGINDAGQVVGWSKLADDTFRGLLWEPNGDMLDLNDLLDESGAGWTLASAQGINNLGQIAGIGFHNGQMRAFVLNPVPEPSSLTGLLGGVSAIAGVAFRRRNRKQPNLGTKGQRAGTVERHRGCRE